MSYSRCRKGAGMSKTAG